MTSPAFMDVHAHFLPPVYREALREAGLKALDGGMPVPEWSPERALSIMDEVGIAGAILSVSSPHLGFATPANAAALSRAINEHAAEMKRLHPRRFGAYAILPLPDIAASLAELDHALDVLGLDGVAVPTHAQGRYLGDAAFAPLLAALDARRSTVFVHPTSPCCFEQFGLGLPAPMIEFPFDTTRAALSLLYSGALARHPGIEFILPHAGGTLPFLAARIAAIGASPPLAAKAMAPAQALAALARLHYDTALSTTPQQITALRALAPISRVLYGSDFPFANEAVVRAAASAFAALGLTPEEDAMVRSGNATRLFPAFAAQCRTH